MCYINDRNSSLRPWLISLGLRVGAGFTSAFQKPMISRPQSEGADGINYFWLSHKLNYYPIYSTKQSSKNRTLATVWRIRLRDHQHHRISVFIHRTPQFSENSGSQKWATVLYIGTRRFYNNNNNNNNNEKNLEDRAGKPSIDSLLYLEHYT
jgi:hypothetical protein